MEPSGTARRCGWSTWSTCWLRPWRPGSMSEHTRSGAGDRLASQLAGALGPQAVTAAGEGLVVRPVDEGGVTEALRVIGAGWLDAAGDEGTRPRLAIRGRGFKAAWGDLPAAPGVILDTTARRTG